MTYLIASFLLLWLTSVFYTSVMHYKRLGLEEINKLHWSVKVMAYSTLGVGRVLNLLLNTFVMTILFVEFPQELQTTPRMQRHKHDPSDKLLFGLITSAWMQAYRYKLALAFCRNYLTPFDKKHCD